MIFDAISIGLYQFLEKNRRKIENIEKNVTIDNRWIFVLFSKSIDLKKTVSYKFGVAEHESDVSLQNKIQLFKLFWD